MTKRIVLVVDVDNEPYDTGSDNDIAFNLRNVLVNVAELADGLVENVFVRSVVVNADATGNLEEWASTL